MWAGVITLFPEMFDALMRHGISGRAVKEQLLTLEFWNPRDFTSDKHQSVDDRPYGGGPGMLMKVEPLRDAIRAARNRAPSAKVVYVSPQGQPLRQPVVREMAQREEMILVAGRYEGIDERVIEMEIDEEWSIGDYVLSGGELAIMVILDAIIRWLPGALGHEDSAHEDSYSEGLLDCPHYTRPEVLDGHKVPSILLGGDHEKVRRWRLKQALGRTWQRRRELLSEVELDEEMQILLEEFKLECSEYNKS